MKFQIKCEIFRRSSGRLIGLGETPLRFKIVHQLLAQTCVIIQGGNDIFYEKCIHHQPYVEDIIQFMRRKRAHAHALVRRTDNHFFICKTLERLLYRGVADVILAGKLLDIQLFPRLEYF